MPRPSYEEHRARKRRDSFESETDAGSLASFTTHQSSSSYQYQSQPYTYASSSRLTVPKQRTLSSTSASSSPSPLLQATLSPRPQYPSRLSASSASPSEEITAKRREARRKRREERERTSTLRAEKFDSPLRRLVRWISKKEWKTQSTVLAMLVWIAFRMDMELGRLRRDWTLNRYAFERTVGRVPYFGQWVISLSDRHQLYFLALINLVLGTATWWTSISLWTRKQVEAGGRSWRSKVIAMISVLLAPAFFVISSHTYLSADVPLGLGALGIYFLACGADQTAAVDLILVATMLDSKWGFLLPVLCADVLGRIVSKGPLQGLQYAWKVAMRPIGLFVVKGFVDRTQGESLGSLMDGYMVRWWSDSQLNTSHVCDMFTPNLWCTTDLVMHWASWMSTFTINTVRTTTAKIANSQVASMTALILLAPIVGVVFYTASTTRGAPAAQSTLLPIALFTSTLTLALFLPQSTPETFIVCLLPLSLMSCMRGGKDDMGDGVDWEWTVVMHNTITFYLVCTGGTRVKALGLSALQVWNYLLGNSKTQAEESSLRELREYVYFVGMALSAASIFFAPPPLWDEMLCLLTFTVFLSVWVWGMSRMYLTAWGSIGLSRKMV